jgi:glyoxylase I family protein
MQPLGVDHVAINVSDVPAAIDFYTAVLGLRRRSDRPDLGFAGAWMDAGSQQVHFIEASVPPSLGQHFSLLVEDIDQAVTDIRSLGVEVSDPLPVGPDRQAFLVDPSGNTVELHQRG